MKVVLLVCFLGSVAVSLGVVLEPVPDYDWKVYTGLTPWNALKIVKDGCTSPIYIGLGWFREGLLPSGLYLNSSEVVATSRRRLLNTDKNTMILCTSHPQLYRWIPTTAQGFDELKDRCELVVAGVEDDETIYIGRHEQDGQMMLGKISKYTSRELVLPAGNDYFEKRYNMYEVLAFNCKMQC